MIFFILSKDGWKIKNMATRQEVCISDSQLALAHQIVKPK